MKLELLHIAGCPNVDAARDLVRKTVTEFDLAEGIEEIEVSDAAAATALRFPGSPTIRVNGIDVDTPSSGQDVFGLCCRTYLIDGGLRGLPTQEMIRKAIQSAVRISETETS